MLFSTVSATFNFILRDVILLNSLSKTSHKSLSASLRKLYSTGRFTSHLIHSRRGNDPSSSDFLSLCFVILLKIFYFLQAFIALEQITSAHHSIGVCSIGMHIPAKETPAFVISYYELYRPTVFKNMQAHICLLVTAGRHFYYPVHCPSLRSPAAVFPCSDPWLCRVQSSGEINRA